MEHHVYFWLKEECKNAADRASFEQGLSDLLKLPGLVRGLWGRPAAVMPRPVIDLSWDYALSMTFTDVAAQDAYQIDPIRPVALRMRVRALAAVSRARSAPWRRTSSTYPGSARISSRRARIGAK